MTVNVTAPTDEQKNIMQEYAEQADKLIKMVCAYENSFAATNAIARVYESVHWFHSFVLNGAKLAAKEGELIEKVATSTIN